MPMTFDYEKTNALSKALGGRVELLQELIKLRKADLSYSQIQDIVKSGFAKDFFDIGEQIVVKYTDVDGTVYDLPFDIVSFEPVVKEGETEASPAMWLESHYAVAGPIFDTNDAFYFAKDGLAAGTYCFEFGSSEYCAFDLTEDVPAGGQILIAAKNSTHQWIADFDKSKWYVHTFASNTATEPIEKNIVLRTPTESEGTYLGKILGKSINEEADINSLAAFLYGYNRYSTSNAHTWLNSSADIDEWQEPQGIFYRPPKNSGHPGFMRYLDPEFVDIIPNVEVRTRLNTYETGKQNKAFEVTYDKFFLPGTEQEYCETAYAGIEGNYWPYWKERLNLKSPQPWSKTTTPLNYEEHVKYFLINKSTAASTRFRTPSGSSSHLVCGIIASGSLASIYGFISYFPCCVIA